ncbi:hypothetical protein EDD22DRAFT_1005324 [Suillus occidentalis]|nr:hypothetical protein EDD22DRAFT_1005324 [Suillus occidentalis]
MHRVFDSEDTIHSVLKHLKFSPKDLKNVVMTCSRLAGPALNILWSEQSSLVPLIMCLPHDTRKFVDSTIHLSREPTPSEWERLRMGASRVRSGLASRRLFKQFPPATLFPNLCASDPQALQQYRSDIPLIWKFMSPGLEALLLKASAYFPTHKAERFLGALSIEAHGLCQLSISMHGLCSSSEFRKAAKVDPGPAAPVYQARETDTVKGDNSSDIEPLEKEEDSSSESSDESEDESPAYMSSNHLKALFLSHPIQFDQ